MANSTKDHDTNLALDSAIILLNNVTNITMEGLKEIQDLLVYAASPGKDI